MQMKYIFSNSSERDIKPTGTLKNMEGAHNTILIKIKNMPRAQILLLFFFSWASSMHILPPQLVILESSTLTPNFLSRFLCPTTFLVQMSQYLKFKSSKMEFPNLLTPSIL